MNIKQWIKENEEMLGGNGYISSEKVRAFVEGLLLGTENIVNVEDKPFKLEEGMYCELPKGIVTLELCSLLSCSYQRSANIVPNAIFHYVVLWDGLIRSVDFIDPLVCGQRITYEQFLSALKG